MQLHEPLTRNRKLIELLPRRGSLDVRQHLLKISGIGLPIPRIMQFSVHKVENIIARDVSSQCIPVKLFDVRCDVIHPHIAGDFFSNHTIFAFLSLFDAHRTEQPTIFRIRLFPGKPGEELACVGKK